MDYVVSSIRNPSEIQVLKRSKGFTLISIDAPLEDRYKRALSVETKNSRHLMNLWNLNNGKEVMIPTVSSSIPAWIY